MKTAIVNLGTIVNGEWRNPVTRGAQHIWGLHPATEDGWIPRELYARRNHYRHNGLGSSRPGEANGSGRGESTGSRGVQVLSELPARRNAMRCAMAIFPLSPQL